MRSNPLLEGVKTVRDTAKRNAGQAPPGLHLTIHIDGAARGNPGPAGIGVALHAGDELLCRDLCEYIGETTNNVAEYKALLLALKEAKELQPAVVDILSDSELLVRQIQGRYRVRSPHLAVLHAQALRLIHQLSALDCRLSIEHVGRELNRQADALANRAIDRALAAIPRDGARS